MPLIQIEAPAVEPVSVAEVLDSARIDDAVFNAQAAIVIKAIRKLAESKVGRPLITRTMDLVLDDFPSGEIDLVLPNVQSIISVTYLDIAGAEQTLASNKYVLDSVGTPSWLLPAYGTSWPETIAMANALRIRFVVGYGDTAADVPEDIRLWIITHATQMLNSPDGLIDQAFRPLPFVDQFLDDYIVYRAR